MNTSSKIFLVDLESIETRYTAQWKSHLPMVLGRTGKDVIVISGSDQEIEATPGAFLNFAATNIYKSEQAIEISKKFSNGLVKDGDIFLFADAWNPAIIMTKYMIDLFGIKAKIHAIWHAGSYDPADFLGRKIKNKQWSFSFEESLYHAIDMNYFATDFHIKLFKKTFFNINNKKFLKIGFPMEYIKDYTYVNPEKKDIVVFPHRVSEEKQPDVFRNMAKKFPNAEFVICQELGMTKDKYYDTLAVSKVVFSANKQETLGIGVYEGMVSGAIPLVPNRLSYTEMYDKAFMYSTENEALEKCKNFLENYDEIVKSETFTNNLKSLTENFFTPTKMIESLRS